MHDDEVFLAALRRFLQEHQVPVIVPWYDLPQQQQYQEPEKIFVLAQALLRAVGQARDNELYVILADLARDSGTLTPLITACRVARARHHHVLVIVPGPQTPSFSMRDASGRRSSSPVTKPAGSWSTEAIQQRLARRDYERAFQQMRRQLVAVGAAVLRLDADDPLPVVLERLDRLRGYRSRR